MIAGATTVDAIVRAADATRDSCCTDRKLDAGGKEPSRACPANDDVAEEPRELNDPNPAVIAV